ncbi:ferredoxin [Solirhodobacter olei]|uniref:ferredoxin n=1 Tax=Solirhodobacter olei TaxID=2493082 RepID=UPI000FDB27B4|nr:ferredoxin [Solirhodobacter olei]
MTGMESLAKAASDEQLAIFGGFHPDPGEGRGGTLLLLGPAEPGFWPHVQAATEFNDGAPDPLDRWSARVIGALAARFGGEAHFPFGGPPYRPFYSWALRTGRAWASPVTLLVHDTAGLLVSYRGALALPERLPLPAPPQRPCDTCAAPCLAACPVGALGADGYDLDACHGFLDTPAGHACMSGGCRVRCACPVSQSYARLPEQSAYHMRLFHR